jgi:hypothetical protein
MGAEAPPVLKVAQAVPDVTLPNTTALVRLYRAAKARMADSRTVALAFRGEAGAWVRLTGLPRRTSSGRLKSGGRRWRKSREAIAMACLSG